MSIIQPGAQSLPPRTTAGLSAWLGPHRLLAFFVLAFGLTWPFMIADALGSYGLLPFRLALAGPGLVPVLLMAFGPTVAALVVTGVTGGWTAIRALLRRLLIWRVGIQWYAAAILGTGLVFLIASQLYVALGGTLRALPPFGALELVLVWLVSFLAHGLLNGEELGWRGVALPHLLARYNALTASLILGVVWSLFHLPIFFTRGGGVAGNQANTPVLAFLVGTVSSAVLVTWLYNNTRGSVLFAYLFHAAANTWPDLFHSATTDGVMDWLTSGLFALAAVVVVLVFGAAHLSRKPLSEPLNAMDVSELTPPE